MPIMRNMVSQIPHYLVVFLLLMMSPDSGVNHGVGVANSVGVGCIERERQALLTFKRGVDDEHGSLSSWGDEPGKRECCKWEGIRCDNRTGRVVMLDLRGYQEKRFLVGKISPSLMELHELKYLDLSANLFFGRIPYHLGNLSHLHYLNLSFNFDSEAGNLKWLSHLSNLQFLDLSFTNVSEANDWPKVFGRLPKLSTLKLTACGLSPPKPSSFPYANASKSLATINLDMNFLPSSIFCWLSNSTSSVVSLDLAGNLLTGPIPDSFGEMDSLEHLDLSANQLEGDIPKSFGNLCNLRSLDLSANNFKGHVAFIHDLSLCARPSLETLKLRMTNLSGPIPDFSVLPSLKKIDLSGNNFNGNLPKSIGNLSELEYLDVSLNNLGGVISASDLSNFSKLTFLGLSCACLNISSNWVPRFQLRFLILRSCKLRAPYDFPSWLQTQKNISFLDISDLGISDAIPPWFWNVSSNMIYVNLSNNHIHGTLPSSLRNIGRSIIVDLSSNHLEGPLPTIQYANLTLLLDLSNNNFSGSIIPLSSSSPNILDLSYNHLSGVIPEYCPTNWSNLVVLNLANNNFSGKIPSSIGSLSWIRILVLKNNNFFGKLPSSIKKCKDLTLMDLGDNKLTGRPPWIGESLLALKILILRSNKLHGSIPRHLCQLKQLQILDLANNNLSGTIPQCFSNFTAMIHSASQSDKPMEVAFFEANPILEFIILPLWKYPHPDPSSARRIYKSKYKATIVWRGRADDFYGKNLALLRVIDLSSNHLVGNIPGGLLNLIGLVALNLSTNNLSGAIPYGIDKLNQIESLDLSGNQFSGEIPTSMSNLHFLSHLNVSYNELSGKIPLGTQLQGFDISAYMENQALCGPPLANNCSSSDDQDSNMPAKILDASSKEDDEFKKWLFIGASSGHVVGFWGVCGILFFNRAARVAYFLFMNNAMEWLLVTTAIQRERLLRRTLV